MPFLPHQTHLKKKIKLIFIIADGETSKVKKLLYINKSFAYFKIICYFMEFKIFEPCPNGLSKKS